MLLSFTHTSHSPHTHRIYTSNSHHIHITLKSHSCHTLVALASRHNYITFILHLSRTQLHIGHIQSHTVTHSHKQSHAVIRNHTQSYTPIHTLDYTHLIILKFLYNLGRNENLRYLAIVFIPF